jgi:serine protease Do
MKTALYCLCLAATGAGAYGMGHALFGANGGTNLPGELSSYRNVCKGVLPAVVTIEARPKATLTQTKVPQGPISPFNVPGLPDEMRKELERFGKQPFSAPDEVPHRAFGSGFVVDASGVVLTNDHVVRGSDEVTVRLQDGRSFTSRDIQRDPKTDLAVVRIQAKGPLPFLKFGDSDAMEIGDRVLAVGAPLGMTGTVTSGIISAKGRDIHMNLYEDFLQTDAAINPGNSGGPLVNLAGEVVGINAAIKSGTGGFQGIGLAVSSNLAKKVMDQLLHGGVVHRGYLGVQVQPLSPEVATRLGVTGNNGVVVAKVLPGGPAAKSGLQDGDVLTDVAGQAVQGPRSLQQIIASLPTGKQVDLGVVRDGARKVLKLTVEEQPQSFGLTDESAAQGPTALDKFGIGVVNLTPKLAKELGYPEKSEGVLVTEVEREGAAATGGLRQGMLIVKVDHQPVKTVAELQKALEKASAKQGWLLQVRTPQGATEYVLLR